MKKPVMTSSLMRFTRKKAVKLIQSVFLALSVFLIQSCQYSYVQLEYRRGIRAEGQGKFSEALSHFDRVIKNNAESDAGVDSLRRSARITYYETEDFLRSIAYHDLLIRHSKSSSERKASQKKIAAIYFEKLTDYKSAIANYNKLLALKNTEDEAISYRLMVARAHFYLNDFFQAQAEIESALKVAADENIRFDLELFLANILFNTKKIEEAIQIYKNLQISNPERSKEQNISMNIVVSYEELEDFDKAIKLLEELKEGYPDPDFVDLKIRRLTERIANLPGARGLRK